MVSDEDADEKLQGPGHFEDFNSYVKVAEGFLTGAYMIRYAFYMIILATKRRKI